MCNYLNGITQKQACKEYLTTRKNEKVSYDFAGNKTIIELGESQELER